jgi:hypothetical protein
MKNLSDLKQLAIRAHNWTSFDPEKRGENLINEFREILNADLLEIQKATEEQKERYVLKFRSLLTAWLHSKSNCMSSMITGPAKFPTQKAEKANNRERGHYDAFMYWRSKAKKAILKSLEPEKTYQSEIERYKRDLTNRLHWQEVCKNANVIIKKAKGQNCFDELVSAGVSIKEAKLIQVPDFARRIGYPSYILTNNLKNIKHIQERIKTLEAKEAISTTGNKEFSFEGGKVVLNYEIDRIMILHDSKPDYSVISNLKHNGFHWSPTNKAWIRQITREAIYKTEILTKINIGG